MFYLLGLLVLVLCFTLLGLWIDREDTPDWVRGAVAIPAIVFLAVGMILTFIDFVTQGWLKRKRWTSRLYYPFYWVFKYLTLSFLYRPMVYNFLDTRFGKRLMWLVVPLYLGLTIIADTGFSTSNYLSAEMNSNSYTANKANYLDGLDRDTPFVDRASIPSRVITDRFLNVFVVYGSTVEDDVFYFNQDLKPEDDRRGIYTTFSQGRLDWVTRNDKTGDYLKTLEDMYTLSVDSLDFKPEFVLSQNPRKQMGFETFLALDSVSRGKHVLAIRRKDHDQDSVFMRTVVRIPFWYYPEEN